VENLWMTRENLVDGPTIPQIVAACRLSPRTGWLCTGFRPSLRLIRNDRSPRISRLLNQKISSLVAKIVHRFEESIAGRPYLIEVALVSPERWRADIVRIPGVPTALMPFYGRTPQEAARHLMAWLTRAYERMAGGAPR
jgi:hypothetical protein